MNSARWLTTVSVAAFLGCQASEAAPTPVSQVASVAARPEARLAADGIEAYAHHYGIYLSGRKVGWMRSALELAPTVRMSTELEARVMGMGQVSEIRLTEVRTFDPATRALSAIEFAQVAATGSVTVRGKAQGTELRLEVGAGGGVTKSTVEISDTLEQELAVVRLASQGKVGERLISAHFDASLQRTLAIEHEIVAREERLFDGVVTPTLQVRSRYPSLGIEESVWVDAKGRVLESRVGGFFVARLEPAEVAKRLDYSQDLLVSAVVKPPRPLADATTLERLELELRGTGNNKLPSSPRQRVSVTKAGVRLELRREREPRGLVLADAARGADPAWLAATPFIQKDHPEIVAAARRAVGDATDVFVATSRLVNFVYEHVRDEYVPSYSNAVDALTTGRGDCTEHAVLFVALARAVGIPAREAVGVAYWPPGGGFGWHAWAEVKTGNAWYTVDPTWNQPIADVSHIKLSEGDLAEQARIVMLLGELEMTSLRAP